MPFTTPVAVNQCWIRLDREWVIVSCGDSVKAVVAQAVNQNIWEAFPGSEQEFRQHYERAWQTGAMSAVVYWGEAFTSVSAHVQGDHLLVSFCSIPITGLRDAIARATEDLADVAPPVPQGAPLLRLVSSP